MSKKALHCLSCDYRWMTEDNMDSCPKCKSANIEYVKDRICLDCGSAWYWHSSTSKKCIKCGSENTTDEIDDYNCKMDDYQLLYNISHDGNFILQMLRLKNNDPIEYQLKMQQFKMTQTNTSNQPHGPYCNSTNLTKVSGTSRFASTLMFGIGSKKVGKQWKCNNCKSYF